MNISIYRGALNLLTRSLKYSSSDGHHAPRPTKLNKIESKIIWFNVKNNYGAYERVPGFVGQSIMHAVKRAQTFNFVADCEGGDQVYPQFERPVDPFSSGLYCSSCQISVDQPWFSRLAHEVGKPNNYEQNIIDTTTYPNATTRLACCIPIEEWMNEMSFKIIDADEVDES